MTAVVTSSLVVTVLSSSDSLCFQWSRSPSPEALIIKRVVRGDILKIDICGPISHEIWPFPRPVNGGFCFRRLWCQIWFAPVDVCPLPRGILSLEISAPPLHLRHRPYRCSQRTRVGDAGTGASSTSGGVASGGIVRGGRVSLYNGHVFFTFQAPKRTRQLWKLRKLCHHSSSPVAGGFVFWSPLERSIPGKIAFVEEGREMPANDIELTAFEVKSGDLLWIWTMSFAGNSFNITFLDLEACSLFACIQTSPSLLHTSSPFLKANAIRCNCVYTSSFSWPNDR